MKYNCIKGFSVEKCDGDGFSIENEYMEIEAGSLWEVDNTSNIIGGEVRLISLSADGLVWLEIPKERLESHFKAEE